MSVRSDASGWPVWCALAISISLALWIYWPGQAGPPLLDDYSSVQILGGVGQDKDLVFDYIYGDRSGPLGRPVSVASFVLEKLLWDDNLAISKCVNILLHLINGCLVAWLLLVMFRALELPSYKYIAVLLAMVWVLSPLYVSTVLYVVQRMAMLSTTFMLLAIISYCRWRELLLDEIRRPLMLVLVLICCIFALFSKENAIVVFPIILLIEALWFQFQGAGGRKSDIAQKVVILLAVIGCAAMLLLFALKYEGIANGYQRRHFTFEERILTQSRILWDYIGQLYWPDVARMGLYHDDINVSTSVLNPDSTYLSLVSWALVFIVTIFAIRWQSGRYLALGVLWFLVGHSVESTVLPLELYFEHRNYFPGIGLLIISGVLIGRLIGHWPKLQAPVLLYGGIYALWLAALTSSQVSIWSNRPLLILSHLNAHPESFRSNTDMAVLMAELGELSAAKQYSSRAFAVSNGEVDRYGDYQIRDLALSCLAAQPVSVDQFAALGTYNSERPLSSVTTLLTLVRLLQDDVCPSFDRHRFADRMAEIFLVEDFHNKASANIYSSLAVLENSLARYENALRYTERFLALSPNDTRGLLMKLHFTTALGQIEQAQAVKSQLKVMDRNGQLTTGEQKTLSLYLENS